MKQNEIGTYWRDSIGVDFRKKALKYLGEYSEKQAVIKINDDNTYNCEWNINTDLSTIVPVGISCNMITKEVCLISRICTSGDIINNEREIKNIEIYDHQNKLIDNNKICIDSIIYLLDFIDDLVNTKKIKHV